jgi:ferredoxin
MADKSQKVPENSPGRWYVDSSCALCDVCTDQAPMLLGYDEDKTYVYFKRQPATPKEIEAAEGARDVCPSGAIGDDG